MSDMTVPKFVKRFFTEDVKRILKHRNYHMSSEELYFEARAKPRTEFNNRAITIVDSHSPLNGTTIPRDVMVRVEGALLKDVIAIRTYSGLKIGNASAYKICGRHRRGGVAPVQRQMLQELKVPVLPFNVFEEAKMNVRNVELIDKGPEEELLMPKQVQNTGYGSTGEWTDVNVHKIEVYKSQVKEKANWLECKMTVEENSTLNSQGGHDYGGKPGRRYVYKYIDKSLLEQRHFVGAMLLRVHNTYFLFDVDRNEVPFYRMNAFLVQLPSAAKTVAEAYDMLMPMEVQEAKNKGKKILRQGEWFLIPVDAAMEKRITALEKSHDEWNKKLNQNPYGESYKPLEAQYKKTEAYTAFKDIRRGAILQAGNNRPNNTSKAIKLNNQLYVSGRMTHSGREHHDLDLVGWYKPIPNTATKSFTIEGNVD